MPTRSYLPYTWLFVSLCTFVFSRRVNVNKDADDQSVGEDGADTSSSTGGKQFLSILTWNVEQLDGTEDDKTNYVNKLVTKTVHEDKVDVVFLQEARACADLEHALKATGMVCVDSTVEPSYEEKMSFTVLGGLILYDPKVFDPKISTTNRAIEMQGKYKYKGKLEWKRWVDNDDVKDKHGQTLEGTWHDSARGCTWNKYRGGKGCSNVYSDVPLTNSIKLFLKSGEWSEELAEAFANGIRTMNIHLFSGGKSGDGLGSREISERRAFQLRALVWMNYIWNYNDKYYDEEDEPVTIYAGDFNSYNSAREIDSILAPAKDYNFKMWKASDSVKTHGGGSLDHVVLSQGPVMSDITLRSSTDMTKQHSRRKDAPNSDHNPLVVKIYATKKGAKKPNAKPSKPHHWGESSKAESGKHPKPDTEKPDKGLFDKDDFPALG